MLSLVDLTCSRYLDDDCSNLYMNRNTATVAHKMTINDKLNGRKKTRWLDGLTTATLALRRHHLQFIIRALASIRRTSHGDSLESWAETIVSLRGLSARRRWQWPVGSSIRFGFFTCALNTWRFARWWRWLCIWWANRPLSVYQEVQYPLARYA